jgi:hypothetical protein
MRVYVGKTILADGDSQREIVFKFCLGRWAGQALFLSSLHRFPLDL